MTTGETTTDFLLDGQSVVREKQGETNIATYLTGPRGVEYRRNDATGAVSWYLYDGLGSVVGEVDEDGDITSTKKYDVYGAVRGSTGSSDSKHKFVGGLGHRTESETGGLTYMGARYYDPVIGRFISEDPAGSGINRYSYCDGNPINYIDLSGEARLRIWSGPGGQFVDLDGPHIDGGQHHIHYGDKGGQWGSLNADGSIHDKGSFKRSPSRRMREGVSKSGKFRVIGYDSITTSFLIDPLAVIAILLDAMGYHSEARQVDGINGLLEM